MKKTILLFFLPLMLVCTVLSAQKGKTTPEVKPGRPNALDNQFNPGNSTSLTGGTTTGTSGGGTTPDYKNVVKMNFALFVRSTFAVHYQRRITDDFSLQGGVGYCYGPDKANLLSGNDGYLSENTKSVISLGNIQQYGKFTQGANPFLAASVRFNFDGFYSYYYGSGDGNSYIDLGLRYVGQHYNLTTIGTNNSGPTITGDGRVAVRNTWYTLTYGYQLEAGSKIITTHEFYVGGGIRKSSYNIFQQNQSTYNPQTGNYENTITKTNQREKVYSIAIMVGYVLGFGF